ncbi:VTT domain-containing protein [Granulicella arctica]|uniref:Membrane protein DedA with SNARE-associated domain/rhodanese-related sulfurtransferase n=1 Tax=Granulicella arctica TaxID=940613 RepID=A0A7Y9PHK4_9BACT|nr:VTT domain-containing protein [Granulicella arctica]NYF79981.1 membrane protein DedA with SNARE-associated domain/rhodanese-related sulfurtransferase [Granulicella arctica]
MPIALAFFVQYAYGILFLWVLVEQLGIPIPSIPVLLTAGTLSATHRIHASYALLVVLAACLLADSIWYLLGRRYGNRILNLLCRLSLEADTCVAKTEGYFTRRGPVTLLFAKFVPGLSTVAAPIAGQTGMPYGRFFLYDLAGSVIWAEAYLLAGRFFGDIAKKSAPFFHVLSHFAFAIFVLMVLGFMAYRVFKQRRFLTQVRAMRLEPEELKEMIDKAAAAGNIPPFIVDLRHPLDYLPDPRVLPGAVRISPNEIALHNEKIPRDRDVILYCTCPNEETSAKVAMQLQKVGVYRVRPLHRGFDGWKEAGFPLHHYVEPTAVEQSAASKLIAAI